MCGEVAGSAPGMAWSVFKGQEVLWDSTGAGKRAAEGGAAPHVAGAGQARAQVQP